MKTVPARVPLTPADSVLESIMTAARDVAAAYPLESFFGATVLVMAVCLPLSRRLF